MYSDIVNRFDVLLQESYSKFHFLSQKIGGLVKDQADAAKKAVDSQLEFIKLASQSQKPDDSKLPTLLKPTSDAINEVVSIKDQNRKHEHFNLLSAVAEGITSLGWVTMAPTPAPFIKETIAAAQFYTNKVLVAYKEKCPEMCDWANSWIQFLQHMQDYVRKYHTTGLVWNAKGSVLNGNSVSGPPPPPPPPSADFFKDGAADQPKGDDRAALFASINRGTDITKGLKKVTEDQQTHKNTSLRQSSLVPDRKAPAASPKTAVIRKQPPKLVLDGKKWLVENHSDRNDLVISDTNMSQSINIFNCNDSMLTVKGKVNTITVNQCKKFSIIFDNILSVVEFINSQRLQAQVNGLVPTITIDKVDGIEVFLSKESLSCEIVSSKSSEINISVKNDTTDEYVEYPLPEQLKSVWDGKGFKTIAVEKN